MSKRGQVTVFLIIGLIILLVSGVIIFILKESNLTVQDSFGIESTFLGDQVQNYVDQCLYLTAKDSLLFIGKHGGYYNLPSVYDPDFYLPYYFYEAQDFSPDKTKIEEELGLYIQEQIPFCLQNFESFTSKGTEVKKIGGLKGEANIKEETVQFQLTLPLEVYQGSYVKELRFFSTEIPSKLYPILDFKEKLMEEQVKEPNSLCLSCLWNWSLEKDLQIGMYELSNYTLLFEIKANSSLLDPEEYYFNFLNRYPIINESENNEI